MNLQSTAPTKTSPANVRWWRRDSVIAALLLLVTFLVYFPAWHGEAIFDDDDHLTPPELSSLDGLARIWTELGAVSQYYPVTHSVFWLENQLWGHAMLGYHLVNILLHATAALLFVAILKKLALPGAWLAGFFFALHPVHIESVAWISELKNTLSTVFYLAAALAYLRFDNTRRRSAYITALALFIAALLSKTVTASLPAALLVVFWWRRGRLSWKSDAIPLLPFFALGIAAGLTTAWIERTFIGAEGDAFTLDPFERLLIAGRAVWFYFGKLLWPADLVFIYPRWTLDTAQLWQWLFPATALALVTTLWLLRRRTRTPLATALLFAGTLFPVLGFLNVYPFIYSFVADHYQYLASLPILAALGAAFTHLFRSTRHPLPLYLLPLSVLATLTWQQSHIYKNTEALWQTTLAKNPACFVAHSNLGNLYLQQGRIDDALRHTREAIALRPGFAEIHNNLGNALLAQGRDTDALAEFQKAVALRPTLAVAHFNIGNLFLRQNRPDLALHHFRTAVDLRPEYVAARTNLASILLDQGRIDDADTHIRAALAIRPEDPDALNNLGNILLHRGQPDDAITHYRRALTHSPQHVPAATNLAIALLQTNRSHEAIAHLEQTLRVHSDSVQLHDLLANLFFQQNQPAKAAPHLRASLELNPDSPDTLANLAWLLATTPDSSLRNASESLALAQRALEKTGPENPFALRVLAAALAENTRFPEAIATAGRALALAENNPALAADLRAHLARYRDSLPVRDPAP